MTRRTVELPRGVVVGLAGALAASVLALAFLVGRESGRGQGATPAPASPIAATNAPQLSSPDEPSPPLPALDRPPAAPTDAPPPLPPAAASLPPASAVAPQAPANDPMREQVASYFREVEAIQSQAKTTGDPEAIAQGLIQQGANGDSSGLDGLAAGNRKVRDALRALDVPEPCREHHRQTLALIEESLAMLGRVKGQLGGDDEAGLAALPAQGRALEQKAKDVDALAAQIKRRYGL